MSLLSSALTAIIDVFFSRFYILSFTFPELENLGIIYTEAFFAVFMTGFSGRVRSSTKYLIRIEETMTMVLLPSKFLNE